MINLHAFALRLRGGDDDGGDILRAHRAVVRQDPLRQKPEQPDRKELAESQLVTLAFYRGQPSDLQAFKAQLGDLFLGLALCSHVEKSRPFVRAVGGDKHETASARGDALFCGIYGVAHVHFVKLPAATGLLHRRAQRAENLVYVARLYLFDFI